MWALLGRWPLGRDLSERTSHVFFGSRVLQAAGLPSVKARDGDATGL